MGRPSCASMQRSCTRILASLQEFVLRVQSPKDMLWPCVDSVLATAGTHMQPGSVLPAPDMRWSTLARLVPAFTSTAQQQGVVEDRSPGAAMSLIKPGSESLKHENSGSQVRLLYCYITFLTCIWQMHC